MYLKDDDDEGSLNVREKMSAVVTVRLAKRVTFLRRLVEASH